MKIWLVSFFENTPLDDNQNTRFNSLVNVATDLNHDVTFWSSTFRHNTKKQRFPQTTRKELSPNLEVIYVKTKPYEKNISFGRLWSHYKLGKQLIIEFEAKGDQPDIVFIAYPPISTARSVSDWCKQKQVPFIIDIIDPWPAVIGSHLKGLRSILKLALLPLEISAKASFKRASGVTAISTEYIEWSKRYVSGIPAKHFYPAIDLKTVEDQLSQAEDKETDSFIVIYAGSLGYSYDLTCILEAAELLEEKYGDQIEFVIAGDGPHKERVQEYEKRYRNLTYLGRIPKEVLIHQYKNAKLGLTQHIAGATQSVTYKLFDLLSCGIPVLNSLESEMKDIILQNKVGLHNTPGDGRMLAENIEYYYLNPEEYTKASDRAIEFTRKEGDSAIVYKELLQFILEVSTSYQNRT